MGSANSIFNTCRQIAISLGVAISSLLISLGLHFSGLMGTENIPVDKILSVFISGFLVMPIIALMGIAIICKLNQKMTHLK